MAGMEHSISGLYGSYGFHVSLGDSCSQSVNDASNIRKNVEYTYSPKLNKIFVQRNVNCPFAIGTKEPVPAGSTIEIHVFTKELGPVMRCVNHCSSEQQAFDQAPLHFVRGCSSTALYSNNQDTGELSVSLPLKATQVCLHDIQNLQFTCFSSCVKGNVFIQFSLTCNGMDLERRIFGLHVCRSPGRDRYNYENCTKKKEMKRKLTEPGPVMEEEMFLLSTHRRWIFDILHSTNHALETEARCAAEGGHKMKRTRKRSTSSTSTHTVTPSTQNATTSSSSTHTATCASPDDQRISLRRILVAQ